MSLSFVSKSIQTAREDGGFDEKPVENDKGNLSGNAGSLPQSHQPLFEQLRQLREKEEAERDEAQREIMRGTLALDEEDAAYLDSIQKQKRQVELEKEAAMQQELAAFRAARMSRLEEEEEGDRIAATQKPAPASLTLEEAYSSKSTRRPIPPPPSTMAAVKIVAKRRRVQQDKSPAANPNDDSQSGKKAGLVEPTRTTTTTASAVQKSEGPLGSLLAGYSSSSDHDDDE